MHSHHHHADRDENYDLTPGANSDSPSHLDRLIAFLHSHFGTVEFLSSEEVNAEIRKVEEESKADEDAKEDEKPDAVTRENTQEVDEDKKPQINGHDDAALAQSASRAETTGPVLRIRLDAHIADVTLDDMQVYSTHESLKKRVESVLQVASRTITPLAPIHPKSSWVARGVTKRIAVKSEQ